MSEKLNVEKSLWMTVVVLCAIGVVAGAAWWWYDTITRWVGQ